MAANLSLREMARQLGMSASFASQLENGKSQPSVATLYSIAQLLDISIDSLFGTEDVSSSKRAGDITLSDAGGDAAEGQGETPADTARLTARSDTGSPSQNWNFNAENQGRLSVTTPGSRTRLVMDTGVVWEQLARNTGQHIEFIEIIYPPGSSSTADGRMLRHDGFEYGYLLEGQLHITLGFHEITLQAGQGVGLDSSVPHLFRNPGAIPARGIWFVHHRD